MQWTPPKDTLRVFPHGDLWAVRLWFGLATKLFPTRHEAEVFAREMALKRRPSEVLIIGDNDRVVDREQFLL